ncbi:amino acid adenylation domain-containing protein [Pseudomonas sp. 18175]|uniref:amino acid adenylation domain-containing protein n=1 Tax=Pseudomonas sp. 18175 TaxID=3390056 RepID=UPI003D1D2A47
MTIRTVETLAHYATLVDCIEHHAQHQPHHEALCFVGKPGGPDLRLSYSELSRQVRACAAQLQQQGLGGQTALILFPSGIDYVIALLGCLYAGVIGVPVNLPGVSRVRRVLPKVADITRDCRATAVITSRGIHQSCSDDLHAFAAQHQLQILHTDELASDPGAWVHPPLSGESTAFLQYTSGSTGEPKGVVNLHGALLRNLQFLAQLTRPQDRAPQDTAVVSWLPLFHDLGLIMGILLPLAYGNRAVYMSPMAFMADPLRWLEVASAERATALPCPSFALRLCAEQAALATPQRLAQLDLSSLRCVMPAAEPVLPSQIQAFQAAFGAYGLAAHAIKPAYGLAEATLLVSASVEDGPVTQIDVETSALAHGDAIVQPAASRPVAPGWRRYVSNGSAYDGQDVRIVDPDSHATLAERHVGEIWISGPCIAGGYWDKAELNQQLFKAHTPEAPGREFLRTGDLGFLHDGHLYVTGRLKDMLLFRGQCHYPNDIEVTSGTAHAANVAESGAAFSIALQGDDECEGLVVVQETLKQAGDDAQVYQAIAAQVRGAIAQEHQLATQVVVLIRKGTLPRTTSGKVRRRAVREAYLAGELQTLWVDAQGNVPQANPQLAALQALTPQAQHAHLVAWLAEQTAATLGTIAARAIAPDASLFNYGLDSLSAVRLGALTAQAWGLAVAEEVLFEQPTLNQLAAWLLKQLSPEVQAEPTTLREQPPAAPQAPIAIIGMAFRLPGANGQDANTDEAFWNLLHTAGCAIRPMPSERFRTPTDIPGFGAYLNAVDQFDAAFFGMSPRESMNTDPQQRLLLETAWHALEDAGLRPTRLRSSDSAVFVGIGTGDYGHIPFISGEDSHFDAYWGTGTSFAAACGRLSYTFGWEGPSMAVDTACSASHSALHLAVQSLRAGECGMALSAGVKLQLLPEVDHVLHKAGMLALDGRCKTLDASADGYVRGEGCVVLVLKRLSDALADGDEVRAVIRGTTVRQDGAGSSLSAPNGDAQRRLLQRALSSANLVPDDIDYVELHGTGTRLGDPIEYQSVADVFKGRAEDDPLWLGSVKTNIGHLEAAAGAAGIVKTVLALEHGLIPAAVALQQINPLVNLATIPAHVPTTLSPWPLRQAIRRAGVTSYGFAGTISHIILEQAPAAAPAPTASDSEAPALFVLSARSEKSLRQLATAYHSALAQPCNLSALANAMAHRRDAHEYRIALVASHASELREALHRVASAPQLDEPVARAPRVGFLFTGQGSQYAGMTAGLYARQPLFRQALEAVDAALQPHLGESIIALMHDVDAEERLRQTAMAQPALFATGYALATMWQGLGVTPALMVGHSIGEFAAMVIAGSLTLADAARLIVQRGALMQALQESGSMLAAMLPQAEAEACLANLPPALAEQVSIAAINGPQDVVFSGSRAAIEQLRSALESQGRHSRELAVSHAFHSPLLVPMLDAWREACSTVQGLAPQVAVISTLSGEPLLQAPDADYWVAHARQPVRFAQALERAAADCDVLLEIGAHAVLGAMAQRNQQSQQWPHPVSCVASLRRGGEDLRSVLEACASLYHSGQAFDLDALWPGAQASARQLPRYPFDRQSYWLEYDEDAPRIPLPLQPQPQRAAAHPVDLYRLQWETFAPQCDTATPVCWLVADDASLGNRLMAQLEHAGHSVHNLSPQQWHAEAAHVQDQDLLIYLCGVRAQATDADAVLASRHVWHLTECVRSLQRAGKKPRIVLPTLAAQSLDGQPCDPLQAALSGASRPLSLEYAGPQWLQLDLAAALDDNALVAQIAAALPVLLSVFGKEETLALRDGHWSRPRLTPQPASDLTASASVRNDCVYLVAGAYGALGRHTTDWLVANGARHLLLLARRAAPAGWQARLQLLRAQGVRIEHLDCDVGDAAQVASAFAHIDQNGDTLAGIFHCAGTSRFNDLASLTEEDCSTVTHAKIAGAWHLHQHSQQRALDWFVCFTSISGVWGSRLQVPYGGANAFQDALIRNRRAQGLPGLAVAWGPWGGGAGMSEVDDSLLQLLRAAGIKRLAPTRYLATLGPLLARPHLSADGTWVAVEVDWQQFVPLFALYNPSSTFERCFAQSAKTLSTSDLSTASSLAQMNPAERREAVHGFVIAELARTLRVAPAQLEDHIELLKLGMDSILVMDFSRRCESGLGVRCELKAIFERNTPGGLTDYLLEQLQSNDAQAAPATDEVIVADPLNAAQPFRLTELQHAYWIGRQGHYALGGVACHAYLEADAQGGLDLDLLERCWNTLVKRHGALRIVIGEDGRQRILSQVPDYRLRIADLRTADATTVQAHCADWREHMSHQVMDAASWPLFDVRVTRLPDASVRLHIGIDMLINDATSGQIIWEELAALYRAGNDSAVAGLAPFDISFRDYVLAKYETSQSRRAARDTAKGFWLQAIEALPPAPQLPLRTEALHQASPTFSRRQHRLSAPVWQRLRDFAANAGCTPASLLISVFGEVLAAWSSESRFTLNLTIFDRLPWHADVPRLLGDFTAVTLLPLDYSAPLGMAQRAAEVNGTVLDHLQHRAFSAVDVLREWNRGRERQDSIAMPVVFTSQLGMSDPTKGAAEASVLGTVTYGISQTPQVWLDHQACELEGALIYNWDAVEALFQPGVLDAMFEAYNHLLERLADDEQLWQQPVAALLPAAQVAVRQQINATDAEVSPLCLDQLFFTQAERSPQAIALITHSQQWTYAALASWSRRLAQGLLQHGVQRGDRVAVVMRKGAEQVAACLAIQAAGGAYVPVDADTPAARLAAIVQGSRIALILTQSDCLPIVQEMTEQLSVTVLDASPEAALAWDDQTPYVFRDPLDHAYVIYTSGSTGTPKGVLIDHRGAVNTVLDINRRFGIDANDRVLGLSALYFDLSVYDMFGLFAVGGALVLPQPSGVRDPAHWLDMAQRHGVSVWNSVPALLELFLDEAAASGAALNNLKQVMLSGDWIALHLPPRLHAAAPQARLVAMGGATEASIWSNWFNVEAVAEHWSSIPYGYPLTNQRYRVIDSRLRDCPDYVTGDLCIAGTGLALGYENDPAKTAASFIEHPDGERLYRTGDLARYWADGTLEFLGRRDFQVKIAGNRIELGEIESAMLRHPGVRDAVVDAVGPARGNKRLAAWVVPHAGDNPLFETLGSDGEYNRQRWAHLTDAAHKVMAGGNTDTLEAFWALMDRMGQQMMRDTLQAAGPSLEAVRPSAEFGALVQSWAQTLAPTTPADWAELTPAGERFGLPRSVLLRLRGGAEQRLAVLRGESSALELFYGADQTLAPEQMTRMNPLSAATLAGLAEVIRTCGEHLGRAVRILEIGARSGVAARELLNQLPLTALDYTLTDPAALLVDQARSEFDNASWQACHSLSCRVFDAEQAAASQGMAEHEFDLVIAFNALHRTDDVPALLARISSLLAPGGVLVAPEITRNSDFQLATVALLEGGYTRFADQRRETGLALLDAEQWCAAFAAAGFAQSAALSVDAANPGMHLLLARQVDQVSRFAPRRLIEHLATLLPAYMVPQSLMQLDRLPLSATGKVMRQQLPRAEAGSRRQGSRRHTQQRSTGQVPAALVAIWEKLLGIEGLDASDEFFDLGGDSLIAVRLIERVRHELNAHVSLPDLFDHPQLAAFAERVAQAPAYEDALPALVPDPQNRYAPFPLTDVQQAYWIGRDESFELGGVTTHLYAEIEVDDVPFQSLESAWQQVVTRHDMLRAVIDEHGMQRVLEEVPPYAIAFTDLRQASSGSVSDWLGVLRLELSHEVPDTTTWPLFTVRAAQMSDTRVRLFISLDNLVCDGRSMRTLLAEWSALARRPTETLAPLSASFRDYVLLAEQLELRPSYQRSLEYWQAKLASLPAGPALPQVSGAAIAPPHFTRREARLDATQWQALQAQASARNVTANALLLTAYGEVLSNWCRDRRFTLNLTLFNRPAVHADIDNLIGDFTSLVLLAFDGNTERAFEEQALTLQRQIWADLEHMQVSAVRVLREAARRNRRLEAVAMPVVFTSGLGVANQGDDGESWLGQFVYGISQTPQVWIDQQVVERDGELVFNWDSVDALFPDGLLDAMFASYHDLLLRLASDENVWRQPVQGSLPANRWAHQARPQRASTTATATVELAADDALLQRLSQMLGALLGRDELPVHTNFFELGASSMDLIRLRRQLMDQLQLAVSVTDVFDHTSLAALAAHLGSLQSANGPATVESLDVEQRRRTRLDNDRRRKRDQKSEL